ncbi:uncharacterized protein DS421_6g187360 [Arachis hypogaea]|nr:uncharacterized protein DS421_6g187360 [Arachis hypogaea]
MADESHLSVIKPNPTCSIANSGQNTKYGASETMPQSLHLTRVPGAGDNFTLSLT